LTVFDRVLVKVQVKARKVTVTGPRGQITKDLSHMPVDIRVMNKTAGKNKGLAVRIQMWNGGYKQACSVSTFLSLIRNCFVGVTEVSSSFNF
jgi:large subunit ribosomal protein L9e